MVMDFLGLMFVTGWVVFFLHFILGNLLQIFYRLVGSDEIKISFK